MTFPQNYANVLHVKQNGTTPIKVKNQSPQ